MLKARSLLEEFAASEARDFPSRDDAEKLKWVVKALLIDLDLITLARRVTPLLQEMLSRAIEVAGGC